MNDKNINIYKNYSNRELKGVGEAFELVGCKSPNGINLSVLVMDFLTNEGLKRDHKFLDIGCGCFRIGKDLINYLDHGHYFGMDGCQNIIDQGWTEVLTDEHHIKGPVVKCSWDFSFEEFGVPSFDFMLAQSVITHIPEPDVRLLFHKISEHLSPSGKAFITYSEGCRTDRDVYAWEKKDLFSFLEGTSLDLHHIGEWGHPRHQQIFYLSQVAQ